MNNDFKWILFEDSQFNIGNEYGDGYGGYGNGYGSGYGSYGSGGDGW